MRLEFRAAEAADVDVAVDLIHASGPAAFDYVFADARGDARIFLREAFIDGAGEFGYRNHVVAVQDGRVIAIGAGFGAETGMRFMVAALRQITRHFGWRMAGPVVRGLRVERVIRPPGTGEHYLAHLGVRREYRGQGIGRTLIRYLMQRGRDHGCRQATLDVALSNPRAEKLYRELGFTVTAERHARLRNVRGAVPAHRRMAMPLQ